MCNKNQLYHKLKKLNLKKSDLEKTALFRIKSNLSKEEMERLLQVLRKVFI